MKNNPQILIIDDDHAFRTLTQNLLEDEGYRVITAENATAGLLRVQENHFDLLLSDLMMEGMNGIQFLQEVKKLYPKLMVIMITGYASINSAVEAMKLGAEDYLTKPCSNEELIIKIKKVLERKQAYDELEQLKSSLIERHQFYHIIGKSKPMQKLYSLIEQIASTDTTVLIQGETGTGKELVAKAIHFNSQRKDKPFIAVNCAALPETLLESELFGHEKGAFSGAIQQKLGRFELAHGGTLFLDEIGDIPLSTQVKLLRVLQEHAFERVGGIKTIETDIRLITATNKDLKQGIAQKDFREDLYFRLNVMPITLPPLRERPEDIPILALHFLKRFTERFNKPVVSISEAAMKIMLNYRWQGNVRELENVMERAVILCNGKTIDVEHLSFYEQVKELEFLYDSIQKKLTEQELTEIYARMILKEHNGNKKEACRTLGLNFKTLQRRLGELKE